MRIYLSGPVTGQEKTAYKRFADAWYEVFQTYGSAIEIIEPLDSNRFIFRYCKMDKLTNKDFMTISMAMLSTCDAIYMMRGWEKSAGCMEEYQYAVEHGYKIFYQEGD